MAALCRVEVIEGYTVGIKLDLRLKTLLYLLIGQHLYQAYMENVPVDGDQIVQIYPMCLREGFN